MYEESTKEISVQAEPKFISRESNSDGYYYIFSYKITIRNESSSPCQLLSRHWIIRDGTGHEEHVVGDGVIGKQPVIDPGSSYTYTSGCPLTTPTGNMRGRYRMLNSNNSEFDIKVPLFFLRAH